MRLFDFPSPDTHSPNRPLTTAPQQALYLLNNRFVRERARAVARIPASGAERLEQFYQMVLQRSSTREEKRRGLAFLAEGGRIDELVQVLMLSNEFLFID